MERCGGNTPSFQHDRDEESGYFRYTDARIGSPLLR